MKRTRFSGEQIIGVLQAAAGAKTRELARRHGVWDAPIYKWTAQYGGHAVSPAPIGRACATARSGVTMPMIGRRCALAQQRRRFGYRRLHILLRREDAMINGKKAQRLYREEGLMVPQIRNRRRAIGARALAPVLALPN